MFHVARLAGPAYLYEFVRNVAWHAKRSAAKGENRLYEFLLNHPKPPKPAPKDGNGGRRRQEGRQSVRVPLRLPEAAEARAQRPSLVSRAEILD
jgi:hypothetical protein